jgi:rhamnosyltransferase
MNASSSGRPRICAAIVTYFPASDLADGLQALAAQVSEIVIVDNGSSVELLDAIQRAADAVEAQVIRLGANLGIACALNVALDFARRRECEWLATFDQDSRVTAGMLQEMLRVAHDSPHPERVAVIAPAHVDRRSGIHLDSGAGQHIGPDSRVLYTTMTSGNLVCVGAASAVGGFDGALFIDYVDHEFCLRLRKHGYQILEAQSAKLAHSLGDITAHRLMGRRVLVTNHSVLRRYYISRNRLIVWRQYWKSENTWVLRDMRAFMTELVKILLFERDRWPKIKMVFRGLIDAARGVRGPLRPAS